MVGKFFSDVTSPVAPHFNEASSHRPASQKERLSKKKSFLGSLFANSSSDDEATEPPPAATLSHTKSSQKEQELISFATSSKQHASEAALPPVINEKQPSAYPEPVQHPSSRPGSSLPGGTAYHFDDGINILRDIFPSFDNDVLQAVIGSQRGDLSASVDALLEMSAPDTGDLINLSST